MGGRTGASVGFAMPTWHGATIFNGHLGLLSAMCCQDVSESCDASLFKILSPNTEESWPAESGASKFKLKGPRHAAKTMTKRREIGLNSPRRDTLARLNCLEALAFEGPSKP